MCDIQKCPLEIIHYIQWSWIRKRENAGCHALCHRIDQNPSKLCIVPDNSRNVAHSFLYHIAIAIVLSSLLSKIGQHESDKHLSAVLPALAP